MQKQISQVAEDGVGCTSASSYYSLRSPHLKVYELVQLSEQISLCLHATCEFFLVLLSSLASPGMHD